MDIRIETLARVSLEDYHSLPESPGIYFALDSANRVWYVGISTTNLRNRHSKHEKMENFKECNVQEIAFLPCNDLEELKELEVSVIQKFEPPLNNNFTKKLPQVQLDYGEDRYIERYIEITEIKAALDQELEELKPNLVTLIEREGGKISDPTFTAYLSTRKTYKHSKKVEDLEKLLKQTKSQEKANQIAEITRITVSPVVRLKK